MKVSELIKLLQEKNPDAEISVVTATNTNSWEYTSNPKVTSHKNRSGETVWIQ